MQVETFKLESWKWKKYQSHLLCSLISSISSFFHPIDFIMFHSFILSSSPCFLFYFLIFYFTYHASFFTLINTTVIYIPLWLLHPSLSFKIYFFLFFSCSCTVLYVYSFHSFKLWFKSSQIVPTTHWRSDLTQSQGTEPVLTLSFYTLPFFSYIFHSFLFQMFFSFSYFKLAPHTFFHLGKLFFFFMHLSSLYTLFFFNTLFLFILFFFKHFVSFLYTSTTHLCFIILLQQQKLFKVCLSIGKKQNYCWQWTQAEWQKPNDLLVHK